MHMKRNLTLAVALGLLAVPAFSNTNISQNLHIPSVTAHAYTRFQTRHVTLNQPVTAEKVYQNPKGDIYNKDLGTTTFPAGDNVTVNDQGTNGIVTNIADANQGDGKDDIQDTVNLSAVDFAKKYGENNGSINSQESQGNNDSTQSNSSNTLPQTGEVNNQAKRIASSIVLGATGLGLGAIALKKHKKQKELANINTISGTTSNNDNRIDYLLNNIKNNTTKLNNYTSEINSEP